MVYLPTTWSMKIDYDKYTIGENCISDMVKRAQKEICIQNSKHIVKKKHGYKFMSPNNNYVKDKLYSRMFPFEHKLMLEIHSSQQSTWM